MGGVLKLSIQFHYWQLACSYFVFLPESDLGECTFLRICSAQRASRQLAPCGEKLYNCNLFMGHPPGGMGLDSTTTPLFSAFLWSVFCLYISCHLFPFYLNWSPFHFHSVTVITLVPWVKCICGLHLCKHYTHWIQANTLLKIL